MTATPAGLTPENLAAITTRVRPFTMAPDLAVHFTALETVRLITAGVPGVLVECGAWRGGCSMAMLLAQAELFGQVVRPVHLLDSFAGLPAAAERDGPLARRWQSETDSPGYHDNCMASEEQLRADMASLGFSEGEYFVHPGWFADTLPSLAAQLGETPIALLRLDGDWYDSTLVCLHHLEPRVAVEGTVLIDDYYAWDGCARAVHDYLSAGDHAYRIKSLAGFCGAYFTKRAARDAFEIV
jgi:O-methyltransferase